MSLTSWKVGDHTIELEYGDWFRGSRTYTLKVDGVIKEKKKKYLGRPDFCFEIDGQKIEIEWSSWTGFAKPRCRVDGKLREPEIEEALSKWWLILVFVIIFFIGYLIHRYVIVS